MLTPDFSEWQTNVTVRSLNKDMSSPFFYDGLKHYNSLGGEKIIKKAPGEQGAQPPQEQSFFQKYWLYIMMAFVILPRLLGDEPPQGEG